MAYTWLTANVGLVKIADIEMKLGTSPYSDPPDTFQYVPAPVVGYSNVPFFPTGLLYISSGSWNQKQNSPWQTLAHITYNWLDSGGCRSVTLGTPNASYPWSLANGNVSYHSIGGLMSIQTGYNQPLGTAYGFQTNELVQAPIYGASRNSINSNMIAIPTATQYGGVNAFTGASGNAPQFPVVVGENAGLLGSNPRFGTSSTTTIPTTTWCSGQNTLLSNLSSYAANSGSTMIGVFRNQLAAAVTKVAVSGTFSNGQLLTGGNTYVLNEQPIPVLSGFFDTGFGWDAFYQQCLAGGTGALGFTMDPAYLKLYTLRQAGNTLNGVTYSRPTYIDLLANTTFTGVGGQAVVNSMYLSDPADDFFFSQNYGGSTLKYNIVNGQPVGSTTGSNQAYALPFWCPYGACLLVTFPALALAWVFVLTRDTGGRPVAYQKIRLVAGDAAAKKMLSLTSSAILPTIYGFDASGNFWMHAPTSDAVRNVTSLAFPQYPDLLIPFQPTGWDIGCVDNQGCYSIGLVPHT